MTSSSEEYVKSKAIIYGCDPSKRITPYQSQINSAATELALADPSLLQSRKALLEHARRKVNIDYKFKKGKSRSKSACASGDDTPPLPKYQKTSETIRTRHIGDLEDDMRDISDCELRLNFHETTRCVIRLLKRCQL